MSWLFLWCLGFQSSQSEGVVQFYCNYTTDCLVCLAYECEMRVFDCVDDCNGNSNCWTTEEDRTIDEICEARTEQLAKEGQCPPFPSEGCLDQTEALFPFLIDKGCVNDISCSGEEKCCKNGCPLYDQFECVSAVHNTRGVECVIGMTTVSNWSCGALGIVFLIIILTILLIVTICVCYFLRPSGNIFAALNKTEDNSMKPRETAAPLLQRPVVQPARVVQPAPVVQPVAQPVTIEETEATALWRPVENEICWGQPVWNSRVQRL